MESKSVVHFCQPEPENLDNPEKPIFFLIIYGFRIRVTDMDTRYRFCRFKKA